MSTSHSVAAHFDGPFKVDALEAWATEVRKQFPDGLFWLTLGSEANIAAKTSELRAALPTDDPSLA